jgi:hypothetical protein
MRNCLVSRTEVQHVQVIERNIVTIASAEDDAQPTDAIEREAVAT